MIRQTNAIEINPTRSDPAEKYEQSLVDKQKLGSVAKCQDSGVVSKN